MAYAAAGVAGLLMGGGLLVAGGRPWWLATVLVGTGLYTLHSANRIKEVEELDEGLVIRGWFRERRVPYAELVSYTPPGPRSMVGGLNFSRETVPVMPRLLPEVMMARLRARCPAVVLRELDLHPFWR